MNTKTAYARRWAQTLFLQTKLGNSLSPAGRNYSLQKFQFSMMKRRPHFVTKPELCPDMFCQNNYIFDWEPNHK